MDINESFHNFRNQFPSGRLLLHYSRRETEMSCPLISDLSRYLVIWIVRGPPEVIGLSISPVIRNWPIHLAVAPHWKVSLPLFRLGNAFSGGGPADISFVYVAGSHFLNVEFTNVSTESLSSRSLDLQSSFNNNSIPISISNN